MELRLTPWQYKVKHISFKKFRLGEKVFLKSNPEVEMRVFDFIEEENKIIATWSDCNGIKQYSAFVPEVILQYRYAGLVVYKNRIWEICLN